MASQESPESFRLLVKKIVVDELSSESLNTLHWKLKLPRKLLDENALAMAILRSLEERGKLFEWSKKPEILIEILTETLQREDLAFQVQEWSDRHSLNALEPNEHVIPQQETAREEDTPPLTTETSVVSSQLKTRLMRKQSLRRSLKKDVLESVEEHSDEENESILISSGERKEDIEFLMEIHRNNIQRRRAGVGNETQDDSRIVSVASSGYCTDSQRFSEFSLSEVWSNELPVSTGNLFAGEIQFPRNSVCDTDQFYQVRPRSKSLGNARSARTQVNNKLYKGTTTSSSSSLKSENSEMTSWSSVSSQRSISSEEQNTTDQDSNGGSSLESQESAKAGSLRRAHTISSICITGQISIPVKKVKEDIDEEKNLPRTSDPFPCSKDIQYQLRFFSSNLAKKGCALYIDVAPKYLKKQIKRAKAIKIPEMEVTVDVNVCCYPNPKQKIANAFEHVKSNIIDLSQATNTIVCLFPNLLDFEKLKQCDITSKSDLVVEVYLKCV